MKEKDVEQEPKPMTCADAGRKGGKTCSERYGKEFFKALGQKGGNKTKERHGKEHYERIGKIGGAKIAKAFGQEPLDEAPEAGS